MTKLYRIEGMYTTGWELIDESASGLTKEECDQKLQSYLALGHNPQFLRAVPDVIAD